MAVGDMIGVRGKLCSICTFQEELKKDVIWCELQPDGTNWCDFFVKV